MRRDSVLLSAWFIVFVGIWTSLMGIEISTQDGLILALNSSTGNISAVKIKGKTLPLLSDVNGGLAFIEPTPITEPYTIFYEDFNNTEVSWNSAIMSNWNSTEIYYTRFNTGGVDNSPYLRLGDGVHTGCGIAFPVAIPVVPMNNLRISWCGRSRNTESKYIFCVRLFNKKGEDITAQTSPPPGWIYSGASLAHCVFGMTNQSAGKWEQFTYEYSVPEGATSMTISLRYWRDGDFYVDIDNLKIEVIGGINLNEPTPISAPVSTSGNNIYQQVAILPTEHLKFTTTYRPFPEYIRADVVIEDTSVPFRNRPLRVIYSIPINATGWNWGDDINQHRQIVDGEDYDYTFSMLSRSVSVYPWSALYNDESGFSLAVPMDVPRIQHFRYREYEGLQTIFDVCLSTETIHIGQGKASLSFILYQFSPEWGFRSATKKYYDIFPEFFVKRTERDGCWLYPVSPDQIPHPEDFGFAFFECWPKPESVRNYCHQLGIDIFYYMEPWGAWQSYGEITEKPSYDERVATLEEWAADTSSSARWLRAPRYYTAQAVLNSGYRDANGRFYIDASDYYWHQWGGYANQFWPCYPDTDFSGVSMGTLYKTYFVENYEQEYDGIYVDSITVYGNNMGNIEDFKREHFKSAKTPLTFSTQNARPVIASQLAQYDFLNWLSGYLHSRNKKVMGNIFSYAYRYYAHLLDILGSEVWDVSEPDAIAALRRTLCYKKVNTNLLQWFRGDDFVDHNEVEQYIKNQLFWGFFPGIASCGGGIGWGETLERYFLHPELYERDRNLFRKYIPIIQELSHAGWEPITFAKTDKPDVLIERFGDKNNRHIFFTLKNNASSTLTTHITIDAYGLGISENELTRVKGFETLTSSTLVLNVEKPTMQIRCEITIPPNEIRCIRLTPPSLAVTPTRWLLFF